MRPLQLATALLICSALADAQDTEVLFLGNSYTNVNGLADLVQGLAAASGVTLAKDKKAIPSPRNLRHLRSGRLEDGGDCAGSVSWVSLFWGGGGPSPDPAATRGLPLLAA